MTDRQLVRELVLIIVIKLVVLMGLWWFFFHNQRADVDAADTALHLAQPDHSNQGKVEYDE